MVIYLRHPVHGVKVATMEAEAQADEKRGWVRDTADTPDVNQLAKPRGRPRKEVTE